MLPPHLDEPVWLADLDSTSYPPPTSLPARQFAAVASFPLAADVARSVHHSLVLLPKHWQRQLVSRLPSSALLVEFYLLKRQKKNLFKKYRTTKDGIHFSNAIKE